jgi:hypothetical protein
MGSDPGGRAPCVGRSPPCAGRAAPDDFAGTPERGASADNLRARNLEGGSSAPLGRPSFSFDFVETNIDCIEDACILVEAPFGRVEANERRRGPPCRGRPAIDDGAVSADVSQRERPGDLGRTSSVSTRTPGVSMKTRGERTPPKGDRGRSRGARNHQKGARAHRMLARGRSESPVGKCRMLRGEARVRDRRCRVLRERGRGLDRDDRVLENGDRTFVHRGICSGETAGCWRALKGRFEEPVLCLFAADVSRRKRQAVVRQPIVADGKGRPVEISHRVLESGSRLAFVHAH